MRLLKILESGASDLRMPSSQSTKPARRFFRPKLPVRESQGHYEFAGCWDLRYRPAASEIFVKRDVSKPFVIMYHGSLVERHGLDLAVTALGKIKESVPSAELRVYGRSTPYLEQVMDSVRKSPLSEVVRYLGPRKLEQIVEAIGECDVGVIPNRRSIFTELNTPTRIFEYLSQGKPVIAPRLRESWTIWPEELILFELGDADDLAAKIKRLITRRCRGSLSAGRKCIERTNGAPSDCAS